MLIEETWLKIRAQEVLNQNIASTGYSKHTVVGRNGHSITGNHKPESMEFLR